MPEKIATFSIRLDSNAKDVAREDSAELQSLRDKIRGSSDAIKQMSAAYRSLRGSTDEVKGAKGQLKAMIDAERASLSAANLAILKQGTTYEKLADKQRKAVKVQQEAKESADKLKSAIGVAGGPVKDLADKLGTLKSFAGGAGGGMGLLTFASAAAVAVLVGLTAAVVAGTAALASWIVEGANAARTMGLIREAASGSAQNAANLGSQIDALSGKVATSKGKLQELAVSLTKSLSGTRASGQGIVDTFNLVAQASEAMGDEVGNQLGEIIKRGKQFGRVQINPFELQGTGLQFQDIAKELATQMHVTVGAAQTALFQGRVKIDDAAKALRTTVEKRFGEINARKLLDLDVQMAKFREHLAALTSGVNLEPLLKGFSQILSLFDSSTVAGATLKDTITVIGNTIGKVFSAAVPDIQAFVKKFINGALDVAIAGLRIALALVQSKESIGKFFKAFDGVLTVRNLVIGLTAVVAGLTAAFVALAVSTVAFWGPIVGIGVAVAGLVALIPTLIKAWDALNDWAKGAAESMAAVGKAIIDGIIHGLETGWKFLVDKVTGLADAVKAAFKGALGIASPSKVFAVYGQQTAEGAAQGMDRGAPSVQASADAMAPRPPAGTSRGARGDGGGASVNVTVNINVGGGGGGGQETAKALSEPSFLAQITSAIEDALSGAGIPTQQAPA